MADSRILEVLIAADDHRMLSANAEAWWLVQNDVFVPFESFLTEKSKQLFLEHLSNSDTSWFLSFFSNEPETAYLTRIDPDESSGGNATIRIVLTRLDILMEEHLRQNDALISYDEMLSFYDDLYYEYLPETDQVILYNTRQSHFTQGIMPLDEFRRELEQKCHAEALPALQEWMDHLRKGTPRFKLSIPCNIINREDQGVHSVIVRGSQTRHHNGKPAQVGTVHPVRERTNEENEVTYDALTGAVSKEHITRIAQDRINRLKAEGTAIAILDVDFFKHVNDNFGHQQGDEILRQMTAIMQDELKSAGLVGRIGGDEFMLLFYHVSGETELRAYLRSIKSVVGATLDQVTVSIGAAVYPNDAANYNDIFMVADYCLYLAKEKGRNRYIIHTLAKHPPVDEIRKIQADGERNLVKGRDDLPLGEALVQMQFMVQYGKQPAITSMLNEFAARANLPLVSLWRRDDRSLIAVGGKEKNDVDALRKYFENHAPDELWISRYVCDGMCVMNTVDKPEEGYLEVREPLTACEIGSYIYIPFDDADGIPAALIFAVVHRKVFWNQQQYSHFRLFADTLARCRLGDFTGGKRYRFPDAARIAMENLEQPFAVYQTVDGQMNTLLVSNGFCRLLGYADREQAIYNMDNFIYRGIHPDDKARIMEANRRFTESEEEYDVVFRTKAGVKTDYHVIHAHGKHLYPVEGVRISQVWYMDEGPYVEGDESAGSGMNQLINSALHEESILKATHYDELTGLPNLAFFFKLCEVERARILRGGNQGILIYFDLGGMKYFNHRHGFAEGDQLLKAFAGLLIRIFGKDRSCHVAGGRFAANTIEGMEEEQLQQLFAEAEKMNGGNTVPVMAGIYSTGVEDVPVSSAYDRAKVACDTIRKSEKSAFCYYSAELRDWARRRRHILGNIDRAVAERWIRVYYQPIVRAVNERVCEEEALARWIDPEEGFLSPAEFIPHLENVGLIYKLDLCVLDQVLEKLQGQQKAGVNLTPHSINLSRADFDACDMVEEIRKRVDASGVGREMIAIEITESVIGSDFEFIREQVNRFRSLGFPVWMDDFGSGYSSLDVLQGIQFDLIKFDMSFMRRLNEGEKGKIILTELMKMATFLNLDTVCEGVETEEQFRFLQEIGCSKLQGYYFSKPMSLEEIRQKSRLGLGTGFEDPDTSDYFETIGRVNLYDLSVIASQDEQSFQHAFNTVPMGIIEIQGDGARFVRSNPSYREFMRRFFGIDMSTAMHDYVKYSVAFMNNIVRKCCEQDSRSFYNEKMPDGSIVHSFARKIGENPQTGDMAVAVAILSISEPSEGESYADIARALAADYYNIYVVDLDTERFIEYTSPVGVEEMAEERHGTDFFQASREATMQRIYEEDREMFLTWFTKENVVRELDEQGVFTTTYRLIDTGTPMYVNMKITRLQGTNRIILGVSIIDSQMKQQAQMQNKKENGSL